MRPNQYSAEKRRKELEKKRKKEEKKRRHAELKGHDSAEEDQETSQTKASEDGPAPASENE
jgi:hypothetical protein